MSLVIWLALNACHWFRWKAISCRENTFFQSDK